MERAIPKMKMVLRGDELNRSTHGGRMVSSTVLTLTVIPAIYGLVKQWRLRRGLE